MCVVLCSSFGAGTRGEACDTATLIRMNAERAMRQQSLKANIEKHQNAAKDCERKLTKLKRSRNWENIPSSVLELHGLKELVANLEEFPETCRTLP